MSLSNLTSPFRPPDCDIHSQNAAPRRPTRQARPDQHGHAHLEHLRRVRLLHLVLLALAAQAQQDKLLKNGRGRRRLGRRGRLHRDTQGGRQEALLPHPYIQVLGPRPAHHSSRHFLPHHGRRLRCVCALLHRPGARQHYSAAELRALQEPGHFVHRRQLSQVNCTKQLRAKLCSHDIDIQKLS